MVNLVEKYERKLVRHRLCEPGSILLGSLDDDIEWNAPSPDRPILEEIVAGMNISSILLAAPREPYLSLLDHLALHAAPDGSLHPQDSETRTFLHDIPVVKEYSAAALLPRLRERKCAVVPGRGIVTYGTISPEQAFVTFSSVVFSAFVKFFTDYYYDLRNGNVRAGAAELLQRAVSGHAESLHSFTARPSFAGPFASGSTAVAAMSEAGRLTVESGMVDSFFGNISYNDGETIFISQTGSSLDELEACIDPCPVRGGTTTAITASSEYSAHRSIYGLTDRRAILHGHPKFSVIMSMICDEECENRGLCHVRCSRKRFAGDVPIVPGEVGTGPTGLVNTLPPAMTGRGAIVWGHGLFTTGKNDFTDAFESMIGIEKMCLDLYRKATGT